MCTAHSSSRLLGGLPQCMLGYPPAWAWRSPQVWACRPPWVWAPQARSLNFPLGFGPETCRECWDTTYPPLETCKACWDTTYPPLETCKACWDTTCNACWDTTPPLWTEWQTGAKILPCPKLCLQAVTRMHSSRMRTAHISCHPWGGDVCLGGVCLGRVCLGRMSARGALYTPL